MILAILATTAPALLLPSSLDRRAVISTVAAASCLATTAPTSAAAVPKAWNMRGGVLMPTLALNTVGLTVEGAERAVANAYAAGITHVDFHPGIERDGVARALAAGAVPRASLFLTTKISKPPVGTSPAAAYDLATAQVEADLKVLGVERTDMLMLRDSPDCQVMQAQWKAMEDTLASGATRAIGVINYCESSLACILASAKVKPAVNYFMSHVGMGTDPRGLRSYGEKRGVRTFAYGAVGEPGPSDELLSSPTLRQIGERYGRSADEVALRWVLQSGMACSVRPTTAFGLGKSACDAGEACRAGLRARGTAFDWALSSAEMASLDAMTSPPGNPTLFSSTGCPDSYFATPK